MMLSAHFQDIKATIVGALRQAKKEICIAIWRLDNREIFDSLLTLQQEGVRVILLLQNTNTNNSLDFTRLNGPNSKVYWLEDGSDRLHHKFCIVDDALLVLSSNDWSWQGEADGLESLLVIKNNPEVLGQYKEIFNTAIQKYFSHIQETIDIIEQLKLQLDKTQKEIEKSNIVPEAIQQLLQQYYKPNHQPLPEKIELADRVKEASQKQPSIEHPSSRASWWDGYLSESLKRYFNNSYFNGRTDLSTPADEALVDLLMQEELRLYRFSEDKTTPFSLAGLHGLTDLTKLDCQGIYVNSLQPLNNLKKLESLNCGDNELTSLHGVGQLEALRQLRCPNNQIPYLKELYKIPYLRTLDISGNPLKSFKRYRRFG